jgi:membrane-associated phospholipid phosphatase
MRLPVLVLAVLCSPLGAAAQSVGDDFRNLGRDAWFIVSSPAGASTADLRTTGALAAAAAGLLLLVDEPLHDWLHSEPWIVRGLAPFRESSPISIMGRTWFFLLPLSLAMYGAGHAFDSDDLKDAGMGCMTSNLTTTLTRTGVAHLVNRDRPGEHRGAFRFELLAFGGWGQRSFPGGHASNIMSCASFLNHRFDLGLAEPAIWVLASGVGLARIADEAHWASDTFVGMAYGYAVGRNVAHRFLDRVSPPRAEQSLQVGVGWRITF